MPATKKNMYIYILKKNNTTLFESQVCQMYLKKNDH
jgi:hypothetical protein